MKFRAEIKGPEKIKNNRKKNHENLSWFLEKINKVNKTVARLIRNKREKERRERTQITNIRNEKDDITTDSIDIKKDKNGMVY